MEAAHTLDLSAGDVIADGLRTSTIHLTSDTKGGAQNLLDGPLEVLGQRFEPHRSCDVDDLVEGDRLGMLDVLLFLSITRRLLERSNDQ